jgi:medium-chain acyl-[acyl-carrier-protein] hydrolase
MLKGGEPLLQSSTQTPWLPYNKKITNADLRVFCFPYAGGNPAFYRVWQEKMPAGVEIFPVQLPGRGIRIQEDSFQDLRLLISELVKALLPYLSAPFIFFGHSMGTLLSYELTRYLQIRHQIQPLCLFVSGYRAPHLPALKPPIYHLPDDEFISELIKMNGIPEELSKNKEYLDVFLLSLRADFTICETYQYQPGLKLSCPIITYGGKQDPEATIEQLQAWEEHTTNSFELKMFNGDHFFIHSAENELLKNIITIIKILKNSRI